MIFRIIKLIIWIIVITWIVFYVKYENIKDLKLTENKTINIEKWDNLNLVLKRELWIEWFFLKLYLYNNPELKNFNLQVWSYEVHSWENLKSIIETLKYWSQVKQISLTILPWWNIFDIDNYLTEKWLISKWQFISEAKNTDKYKKDFNFLKDVITLEWFLYPDTHFVDINKFNIEDFTKLLLKNFEEKIYNKYLTNKNSKEIIEILTMASIVEREAFSQWWLEEKKIISWILLKRLDEWWYLWADITVCYPYWLTTWECTPSFISSKVNIDKNDYNTRTKLWLPKTPINNPAINSIISVLEPTKTQYYYYLHDLDWKVYYAKTNDEHNQNKNLHLK